VRISRELFSPRRMDLFFHNECSHNVQRCMLSRLFHFLILRLVSPPRYLFRSTVSFLRWLFQLRKRFFPPPILFKSSFSPCFERVSLSSAECFRFPLTRPASFPALEPVCLPTVCWRVLNVLSGPARSFFLHLGFPVSFLTGVSFGVLDRAVPCSLVPLQLFVATLLPHPKVSKCCATIGHVLG